MADDPDPPVVISISYGGPENPDSQGEVDMYNAFNVHAMKLGVRGVTIMVASGDDGANFFFEPCQGYNPSFPATSPYVTAVGATQGPGGSLSLDNDIACQSNLGGDITSGGGFSKIFSRPSWQTSAVESYFAAAATANVSPESGYNENGRGYPDVSMNGINFYVSLAVVSPSSIYPKTILLLLFPLPYPPRIT